MGIQSIIHTSYFIIHLIGFPCVLTPPAKQQSQEHLADVEAVSFRPAHPLSDQSLERGSAFRRGLDGGGIDNLVACFIELEGELKIFGDGSSPAERIKKVFPDHVDAPRDLFHASVEFGS